jgi:putative ABC transport system permease protein
MGLYALLARSTSLLIAMTLQRALAVFSLTLVMSAGSGWLATGKLRRLDPADIF